MVVIAYRVRARWPHLRAIVHSSPLLTESLHPSVRASIGVGDWTGPVLMDAWTKQRMVTCFQAHLRGKFLEMIRWLVLFLSALKKR